MSIKHELGRSLARLAMKSAAFQQEARNFTEPTDPRLKAAVGLLSGGDDATARLVRDLFTEAPEAHGQLFQDLWVLSELGHKRDGFFVEFGATNGVLRSNSCLLERKYGWKGVLAEPNPVWHDELRANRAALIDTRCVTDRTGDTLKFAATVNPELATLVSKVGADFRGHERDDHEIIDVATISLNDLLTEHGAPSTIDYISVDTEGSEFDILGQFDFSRWDVNLFTVEHNHSEMERPLDQLMASNGYERCYPSISKFDGWYRRVH